MAVYCSTIFLFSVGDRSESGAAAAAVGSGTAAGHQAAGGSDRGKR